MFNDELSEIFSEMADIEEIEGKRWESLAYRKVSGNIAALGEDIREIYRRNELRKIEGVGDAIAKKISQYINEGRITAYDEMKKKYPINFRDLRKIQGLGPKKIAILFTQLSTLPEIARRSMSPTVSRILLDEPAASTLSKRPDARRCSLMYSISLSPFARRILFEPTC